jgi:murein DD-endopeptidase / murein LD-carboxypeptidase
MLAFGLTSYKLKAFHQPAVVPNSRFLFLYYFCTMKKLLLLFSAILVLSGSAIAGGTTSSTDEDKLQQYFSKYTVALDTNLNTAFYENIVRWMGTKYRVPGPGGRRLDCSGFSILLYRESFGMDLSGGSRQIFTQVNPIEKEELVPGDLVFFRINGKTISHVGVYLGNNKFVHSAIKGGVRIDDMDDEYYGKRFFKGGRKL